MDKITVEILDDGSWKMTTDPVSPANHGNAVTLLREIAKLAGGKVKTARKPGAPRTHTHGTHTHTHQ